MKGCFGMQVLRQQRHKCSVDTCRSYNVAHSTEMTEAWTVQRTFQGQLLPQALRCDACGGQKDVLQESKPLSAPEVLIVSFPRNGHVDPHTGRWCKNEREVDCTGPVEINGTLYRIVALVEHIALDCGDAEQGHFVTWTMQGGSWLRVDDTVVTRISALRKKVAKSVVLAVCETCVATSFATEQAATGSVADMTPTDPAANAEENAAGSIAPAMTELASTVLDSQAGPPCLQGFEKQVAMPILRRIFQSVLKSVLKSIGCKAPMAIDAPAREWKLTPALKESEVFALFLERRWRLDCARRLIALLALFGTFMEEL